MSNPEKNTAGKTTPGKNTASDNLFVHATLDRATIRRDDDLWVEDQWQCPERRAILIARDCGWLPGDATGWLDDEQLAVHTFAERWFLGLLDDQPIFAVHISNTDSFDADDAHWQGLRSIAALVSEDDAALYAHALALRHWHELHRFCGACGRPLVVSAAGHARRCEHEDCANDMLFPRVDPAVIVTVTYQDRVLLGRQPHWPEGMYSCLAGFLEAGESLEQAVRREVFEEAGVKVGEVRYSSSQPWPFPQSLMVGFRAEALDDRIVLHDDELEDARWFSRADIGQGLAAGTLKLSSSISISRRLIEEWRQDNKQE